MQVIVAAYRICLWLASASWQHWVTRPQQYWKGPIELSPTIMLRGLKAPQPYWNALQNFHEFCIRKRLHLVTVEDVDMAMALYVLNSSRSQAEYLVAAMLKSHPPLRHHLAWTVALLKDKASVAPAVHHPPMPWEAALLISHQMVRDKRHKLAWTLLLQWRLGMRPGEALRITSNDFVDMSKTGGMIYAVVRVGTKRSTKNNRAQVCRVYSWDWRTCSLLQLMSRVLQPGECVCDIRTVQAYTNNIRRATQRLQIKPLWSGHSARAGWASHRFSIGQPFTELREDGRWSSDSSLRIYLDVIASQQLAHTDLTPFHQSHASYLDANLASGWLTQGYFPAVLPSKPTKTMIRVR